MAADNEPAEAALRANTLRTNAAELAARLPVPTRTVPELPEALILDTPFDTFSAPEWRDGLLMPQSRAAMAVSRALAPEPGERVLDLCAAPGGKTTHLAALMGNRGEIIAIERHEGRAAALRRTAQRMGATIVDVRTADATQPVQDGPYDRVLVDPPCSDLGTLASRPDARWRKAGRPEALAELQQQILAAGASVLKPGGTLVYSTCTISPVENEQVVTGFLAVHEDFAVADLGGDAPVWKHPTMPQTLQTLPHRDRTDGFFIAKLVRA
jgi:16S rRNA (cytosine967-C5)-methyltransferase